MNSEEIDEKRDEYLQTLKDRGNPFVRIDGRLRSSLEYEKWYKSISWIPLVPIIILMFIFLVTTISIINYETATEDQKMISLSAMVILLSVILPIIQYMWNRKNEISNQKIEQYLLLQNQILISSSSLSEKDKKYAQEVLWRIEFLNSSREEDFLDVKYDKEINRLYEELQNKK